MGNEEIEAGQSAGMLESAVPSWALRKQEQSPVEEACAVCAKVLVKGCACGLNEGFGIWSEGGGSHGVFLEKTEGMIQGLAGHP